MKKTSIYFINFLLVCLLINKVVSTNSDKGILFLVFYYPTLIIVNLMIGILLKVANNLIYKGFFGVAIWLGALFIPILLLVAFLDS